MTARAEDRNLVAEWEARAEGPWEDLWANLLPAWRKVLSGSESDVPPPAAPILRRRRITTDYQWMGTFEPLRWLPAVTQALLWDENSMDLGPLTGTFYGQGRSWETLLLGGPANVDLAQLRGIPVRHLILSVVHIDEVSALADIPGLTSVTLDLQSEFIRLPTIAGLKDLVLYSGTHVDDIAVRDNPGLRVARTDVNFSPPFGPFTS